MCNVGANKAAMIGQCGCVAYRLTDEGSTHSSLRYKRTGEARRYRRCRRHFLYFVR